MWHIVKYTGGMPNSSMKVSGSGQNLHMVT